MRWEDLVRQREAIFEIAARHGVTNIRVFGSVARGDARPDSDFDLLVIRESNQRRDERSAPIYTALADVPAEVEVMVYTPAEIEEWRDVPQAFVTTALREGKVLYEKQR